MRIGLFTDTYRPSINGIVFVVESLKKHLEEQGHVVYVFCPARSIRPSKHAIALDEDEHIIRFPSVKGAFFDDYDTSLFFPPRVLNQVKDLDLDVIHFFTPGQIGLMGVYAAYKCNVPLVAQHCTDVYEYVELYPKVFPGILALSSLSPFIFKANRDDLRTLTQLYRPRMGRAKWSRDVIEKMITILYSKCDAVIALSRKSQHQLESWQSHEAHKYPVTLMPNGVDAIPKPTEKKLDAFRELWHISPRDEVFGFVGRLGAEKNLDMLIPTLEKVCRSRPHARLLFVGDFEYRETLEEIASESEFADRITFTGAMPREDLGVAYAAMDVFVFPSLTDTQGWVLHEAAHAGLPIVLIDTEVSEVVEAGVNGEFALNDVDDMADKLSELLKQKKRRELYGAESQKKARQYTEKRQVTKLAKAYEQAIIEHQSKQK